MTKAIWNDTVLAESDNTVLVEGNHYFPPETIQWEYFEESDRHTSCPWKGRASYYDVVVNGNRNAASAWYYPDPSEAASEIEDHVSFWGGIRIEN